MFGKLFIFSAIFAVAICFPEEKATEWANFKAKYNKFYALSEEHQRFTIFSENLDKIKQHNKLYDAGKATYKMGINQFADLTKEEFLNSLKLQGPSPVKNVQNIYSAPMGEELPDSIDYRKQGAVNPIKNQGMCGSCWAFSTTGTMEVNYFLKTGENVSLSEQELNDCSGDYGNMGCRGGLPKYAYGYIIDEGISTDNDYPYTATDEKCKTSVARSGVRVTNYTEIVSGDERSLQSAVANVGAISIGICAYELHFYESGIITEATYCCSFILCLDHGVVVVGYDSENGQDYWIIRNSWGTTWGEEGYFRIARGKNLCGVATAATFPHIA